MSDENNHWCRTSLGEITEGSLTWAIDNFNRRPEETGDSIVSSSIIVKESTKRESKWKLKFYPKGRKEEEENNIAIFLQSDNDFSIKAKFSVSILDSRLKKKQIPGPVAQNCLMEKANHGDVQSGF